MQSVGSRTLSANGLDFAVDEAGEGDAVALLLHGFPESRAMWRDQLPGLAGLGWRAVAPDMRGYGETSRPAGKEAYRIRHLVDDVAALFDVLGARRRILIGHDWGGVVAWQAALRGAIPLDGLVILNAPHPAAFRRALTEGWKQRRRSWYIAFFQLPGLPERGLMRGGGEGLASILRRQSANFPEDLLQTYRRNILRPGAATAMLNYYRANARGLGGPAVLTRMVEVPTLMLWGERDAALDRSLAEGNEAFVSDLTLKRLPGVSHWVVQDAPQTVSAEIASWARAKGLASGRP